MKKFELTTESKINIFGKKLFRIKALISFGNVGEGETGGWIEKEENLEQSSGDAWVYGDAEVSGDADYTTIHGFGTQFRTTTFFRCKDKQIRVSCGCFFGTISEFREQVKNTRKGKIAEEYLMIADLMEKHFAEEAK
nr:MAG TPA: Putative transferase, nesg, ydcK, Structural Genomics.38A [Caudoviricetes sp.]